MSLQVRAVEPPDTNGAVGKTQYVQIVNEAFNVFDKSTGAAMLRSPKGISSLWSGTGILCESGGMGDPIVLYDQLADRWVINQFAGASYPTDECIAISTSGDATGTYYRYDFFLGNNFQDYPKLSVWPDAYYMSINVFNPSTNAFLGQCCPIRGCDVPAGLLSVAKLPGSIDYRGVDAAIEVMEAQ